MVRVNDLTEKTTLIAAGDEVVIIDSEDSDKTKRIAATKFKGDSGITGEQTSIVADDGTGDYETIGAAITDGAKRIFVNEGSYTETYWDLTNKNVRINCASYDTNITFNNTDVHSGTYILADDDTTVIIQDGTFNFTMNSTNSFGLDGNVRDGTFIWKDSIINIDGDDVVGRAFTDLITDRVGENGWFNCKFSFGNATNTNPIKLTDAQSSFNNCKFDGGKVIFGGNSDTTMSSCGIGDIVGIGFDGGRYIDCTIIDISVTTIYDINGTQTGSSIIDWSENSSFAFNGATSVPAGIEIRGSLGSFFNFQETPITLEDDELTYVGHTHSVFVWDGVVTCTIEADSVVGCSFQNGFAGSDISIEKSGSIISGNDFRNTDITLTTSTITLTGNNFIGDLTINGGYSSVSGNANMGDIVVDADNVSITGNTGISDVTFNTGADDNILVANTSVGTVTDNGTGNVNANNT